MIKKDKLDIEQEEVTEGNKVFLVTTLSYKKDGKKKIHSTKKKLIKIKK